MNWNKILSIKQEYTELYAEKIHEHNLYLELWDNTNKMIWIHLHKEQLQQLADFIQNILEEE